MAKRRKRDLSSLFNLQHLQDIGAEFNEIELDAVVERDGKGLILIPDPTNPRMVVRINARDARLGEELPSPPGVVIQRGKLRRVWVKRGTPALRIHAEPFEDIIGSKLPTVGVATLQVKIAFKANAEGSLTYGGKTVPCLGNPTINYTEDLTVQGIVGTDKFVSKYSSEFGVYMNWAVLIMGDRGIYIHEGPDNIADNDGVSAGCIHLADAKSFYDWVTGRTRIQISYPW